MKRPLEVSTAAISLVLIALMMLILTVFNINPGGDAGAMPSAAEMPEGAPSLEEVTRIARIVGISTQALGLGASLLAAAGLWKLRKWGFWIGFILGLIKVLANLPVFFMNAVPIQPLTFVELAIGLIVVILLLIKDSRAAFFPER